MDEILEILSAYIETRNSYLKSAGSVFIRPNSTRELTQFDRMVNSHHQMVFNHLPAMNLTQLEAFSELVNSRLAFYRMHMSQQNR